MKLAAKQAWYQLEWSTLDIEQDEWDRQVAGMAIVAANGFPVYLAAKPAGADGKGSVRPKSGWHPQGISRSVVLAGAAALLVSIVASYAVWHTAKEGILRMQGDVANAVKLETVWARTGQTPPYIQEDVQAVTIQANKAMVTVVVTQTLPTDQITTRPERHFYLLTLKGWQRTRPQAEFWGPAETLDTASLHFVFDSVDRAVVEQLASKAEALYTSLRRATGRPSAADELLTVQLVPDEMAQEGPTGIGYIRLVSPAFAARGVPLPRGDIFVLLQLRHALTGRLLNATLRSDAPQAQLATVEAAVGTWLQFGDGLLPSFPSELMAHQRLGAGVLRLDDLLAGEGQPAVSQSAAEQYYKKADRQGLRWVASVQLIDFLVDEYGIDVLPRLMEAFGKYKGWETLAPAVFGISAEKLEASWRADAVDTATRP